MAVSGSGFEWTISPAQAFPDLAEQYQGQIEAGIKRLADAYRPRIENWMKENAPWTDRTSNARNTLRAEVDQVLGQAVIVILSHGVNYGIFLETISEGKWAIILPALDKFAHEMWADIVRMLSR